MPCSPVRSIPPHLHRSALVAYLGLPAPMSGRPMAAIRRVYTLSPLPPITTYFPSFVRKVPEGTTSAGRAPGCADSTIAMGAVTYVMCVAGGMWNGGRAFTRLCLNEIKRSYRSRCTEPTTKKGAGTETGWALKCLGQKQPSHACDRDVMLSCTSTKDTGL